MSTIYTALIVVAIVLALGWLLISLSKRDREKSAIELLMQFRKIASGKNLLFSCQEILENSVIGLDEIQRKLQFVRKSVDGKFDFLFVDLNLLKDCRVQKVYRTVDRGTDKKKEFEKEVDKIFLHIELLNEEPAELLFFDSLQEPGTRMRELEEKARKWERILSRPR